MNHDDKRTFKDSMTGEHLAKHDFMQEMLKLPI